MYHNDQRSTNQYFLNYVQENKPRKAVVIPELDDRGREAGYCRVGISLLPPFNCFNGLVGRKGTTQEIQRLSFGERQRPYACSKMLNEIES